MQPVLDQRFYRGTSQIGLEAAPGFTAADVGGVGDFLQSDGFFVVLIDVHEHLLKTNLAFQLHPGCFLFWKAVQIAEDILQDLAQVTLHCHFIAGRLLAQTAAGLLNQKVDFAARTVLLPKHNKGQ